MKKLIINLVLAIGLSQSSMGWTNNSLIKLKCTEIIFNNEPSTVQILSDELFLTSPVSERNSIYLNNMRNANVILNLIGHPGIYHGHLDILACGLQPSEFQKVFKEYLNNPNNQILTFE
jgi:hypothetical protein